MADHTSFAMFSGQNFPRNTFEADGVGVDTLSGA